MYKKLKLIGGEKDIDLQLQEIAEELQESAEDEQMTSATAEPGEIEENDLSDVAFPAMSSVHTVETEATSLHAMMPPSFSNVNDVDDDVVTDGGHESNKGNFRAGFNKLYEETTMNSSKQGSFQGL